MFSNALLYSYGVKWGNSPLDVSLYVYIGKCTLTSFYDKMPPKYSFIYVYIPLQFNIY